MMDQYLEVLLIIIEVVHNIIDDVAKVEFDIDIEIRYHHIQ